MLSVVGLLTRRKCTLIVNTKHLTRAASNASGSLNQGILDMLEKSRLEEDTSPTRNRYKVMAFTRAIGSIRALKYPITEADEAKRIPGVGVGISARIAAYLHGELYNPDSEHTTTQKKEKDIDSKVLAIRRLRVISGIGWARASMAMKLVDAGCETMEDLRKPEFYKKLTPTMRVSLNFLHLLDKPVTREEAELLVDFIRDNISCKFEVVIVGSYRRGAQSSGDIDILLLHPSYVNVPIPTVTLSKSVNVNRGRPPIFAITKTGKNANTLFRETPLLGDAVWPLQDRGLIAGALSSGPYKWQGIVRIPRRGGDGKWEARTERIEEIEQRKGEYRRLDLNMIPVKSRGAALLALTGDLEFNRDLRSHASKLGMHLNEYGLWRWVSHNSEPAPDQSQDQVEKQDNEEKGHWELTQADSEEDILHELGRSWIEPSKRNFAYILGNTKKSTKGRPRKATLSSSPSAAEGSTTIKVPKTSVRESHTLAGEAEVSRGRGRPRKVALPTEEKTEDQPKKQVGRPRKEPTERDPEQSVERARGRPRKPPTEGPISDAPKRPRGRPRKPLQEDP